MHDTAARTKPEAALSFERGSVADAMHAGIVCCEPEDSLADVARIMSANRVHCVAVHGTAHDHSGASYVWGVISDVELLRAGAEGAFDTTAGSVAGQPTIAVRPTMALRDASELMLARGVNHLIVNDAETLAPVGLLSTLDVVRALARGSG